MFQWLPELDGVSHSEGDDVIIKMTYDAKVIREKGLEYAVQSGKLKPYFVETSEARKLRSYLCCINNKKIQEDNKYHHIQSLLQK